MSAFKKIHYHSNMFLVLPSVKWMQIPTSNDIKLTEFILKTGLCQIINFSVISVYLVLTYVSHLRYLINSGMQERILIWQSHTIKNRYVKYTQSLMRQHFLLFFYIRCRWIPYLIVQSMGLSIGSPIPMSLNNMFVCLYSMNFMLSN